jgi:hypothetical protein
MANAASILRVNPEEWDKGCQASFRMCAAEMASGLLLVAPPDSDWCLLLVLISD